MSVGPALVRRMSAIAAVVLALAACGGGDSDEADGATGGNGSSETTSAPPSPSPTLEIEVGGGEPVDLNLVVRLGFLRDRFEVPGGAEVSLRFVNHDEIPHNFSLYLDDSMTQSIFEGEQILSGTTTYEFGAPVEPGTYFFVCDVHPTMNGDFVVT